MSIAQLRRARAAGVDVDAAKISVHVEHPTEHNNNTLHHRHATNRSVFKLAYPLLLTLSAVLYYIGVQYSSSGTGFGKQLLAITACATILIATAL